MAKEDFFLDVRRASTLAAPNVETDSNRLVPAGIARRLERAALWLTPKCVEAYNPDSFLDFPQSLQDELKTAVSEFAATAQQVGPDEFAPDDVFREGQARFQHLLAVTRNAVLHEWIPALRHLIQDAESWSKKSGWSSAMRLKELQEKLLGAYEAPQLYIHTDVAPVLLLDPVARFVAGAMGLIDFAVVSPYRSMMIIRSANGWQIELELGKGTSSVESRPWSEEAFLDTAKTLMRQRG